MKIARIACVGLALTLTATPGAFAQWYEGGNLARSTGAQWKAATEANRLATAADFAAVTLGTAKVKALGSIDRLKPYANNMKACIDESVASRVGDSLKTAEVAAICAVMLGWA